jgi:hypothetical protein
LANHGVENRRSDLFYASPVFTDRLRKGIQRFRKIALAAQENGVRRHAFALLGNVGVSGWKEPGKGRPGAAEVLDDECSATKSAENSDCVAFITLGSASEKPVASGWLSGGHKWILERKGGRMWFFTSVRLMMLMAAPVDRLRKRKMLVWSEAWNAEGEKGKTGYYSSIR